MKFNTNAKQISTVVLLVLVDAYRLITGCMLAVFVPQSCYERSSSDVMGNYSLASYSESSTALSSDMQMCTIEENMDPYNQTDYNHFVLSWNYFTVFCFLIAYAYDVRREHFIIWHFDDEDDKPTNWLVNHADRIMPQVWKTYKSIHSVYQVLVGFLVATYIVNCILSGVLVFAMYYLDTKTTTTFLSSVILLAQKIIHMRSVALDQVPRSSYLLENVAFNSFDPLVHKKFDGPIPIDNNTNIIV